MEYDIEQEIPLRVDMVKLFLRAGIQKGVIVVEQIIGKVKNAYDR